MSFVSEIDNDDVDEPGMDMPGFEGTWNELGKIEAMGGDAVGMLKTAVKEAAMSEMEEEFEAAVSALLEGIEAKYNKLFPTHAHKMTLSLAAGSKFIKVIEGGSVWGFIAKRDGSHKGIPFKQGDVFKPASWSAAAKHVRGSIFDENKDWYSWTGPNYL